MLVLVDRNQASMYANHGLFLLVKQAGCSSIDGVNLRDGSSSASTSGRFMTSSMQGRMRAMRTPGGWHGRLPPKGSSREGRASAHILTCVGSGANSTIRLEHPLRHQEGTQRYWLRYPIEIQGVRRHVDYLSNSHITRIGFVSDPLFIQAYLSALVGPLQYTRAIRRHIRSAGVLHERTRCRSSAAHATEGRGAAAEARAHPGERHVVEIRISREEDGCRRG